ncbi:hypothetical protein C1I95_10940 [Micromonospora craterilacus]|uniref:Uncharacterized protein n=1 Tax=Micromonospora craterilacus TaxID=1655439 RepID=A0A2W2ESQ4_9ACTN|nr:hypothetical protein C1I95_10940 [Micromonospora craterilacus]
MRPDTEAVARHPPWPTTAALADPIRRDFTTSAGDVDTRRCGDITYFPSTKDGRRVIGWAPQAISAPNCAKALTNAVSGGPPSHPDEPPYPQVRAGPAGRRP